ncbi:TonB family protein [Acinetobacter oleivorans]|uniref:TonB family protein n=1 Tax=Acinetobacter oleivorans TaxID=1148157 RepID=UPI001580A706|nr:TonB family protein [Acinetobacter oleivorans]NUF32829.1 TonB family protein [Acinetobacter oleivorans]
MSQSSAALNAPNPMKKKVITALIAVAIGHIGVLWAVSHIKPAELKPIDKKPLQVRFLTIKEDVPPPPAKVEPIKPKVEPKPVEKKVEPKPVEKPKVIAQKVQKVEPKVIQQDDTQEKLKKQQELEKQRLEQLQREQALKEQQAREQALKDQQAREQAARDQQAREQAREQAQSTVVEKVSKGDVEWAMGQKWVDKQVQSAVNEFADKYSTIKGQFALTLNLSVNEKGKITSVTVAKSTGNPKIDQKMIQVISRQRFKPYMVNGVAKPFTVPLPLVIGF